MLHRHESRRAGFFEPAVYQTAQPFGRKPGFSFVPTRQLRLGNPLVHVAPVVRDLNEAINQTAPTFEIDPAVFRLGEPVNGSRPQPLTQPATDFDLGRARKRLQDFDGLWLVSR